VLKIDIIRGHTNITVYYRYEEVAQVTLPRLKLNEYREEEELVKVSDMSLNFVPQLL